LSLGEKDDRDFDIPIIGSSMPFLELKSMEERIFLTSPITGLWARFLVLLQAFDETCRSTRFAGFPSAISRCQPWMRL
jgi:hypothetical protein